MIRELGLRVNNGARNDEHNRLRTGLVHQHFASSQSEQDSAQTPLNRTLAGLYAAYRSRSWWVTRPCAP